MKIALDYTTGIYPGAGIARYTRSLVGALAELDAENSYRLFYAARGLPRPTPETRQAAALFRRHPNFRPARVPVSVREMFALWQRLRAPVPVDLFTGRIDLLHSPDFVSPPHIGGKDVITVHDLSFMVVPECAEPKLAAFLGKAVPRAVRRADHIIAVSRQTRDDLVRLLDVPPSKVTVAYNGVDERFVPGASPGKAADLRKSLGLPGRFILHIGTLEPRKNLARLVEAYGLLLKRAEAGDGSSLRDVGLVLAGRRGWLYEPVLAAAEGVNAAGGRVVLVDFVRDDDLPTLYNLADGFAYPSLYEGFGLPAAEAMACGVPTLVSRDGALAEVVGDAALKVDAHSVEAIAGGLEKLLADEGLRRRLSDAGPGQVSRFTWQAAARTVLDVYKGLVAS
ncbi:MAG TPA: glycosyltransferase family 1 protein [Chloroflexia bacterium]|jgi:glycosyltransferase involved in cell wall biosynthesis